MSKRWLSPVVVAAMAGFALATWSRLPDRIPIHFDAGGAADGWAGRWPGAFSFAGIALAAWLLLLALRKIDPRREHYQRFDDTYWTVLNVVTLLLAAMEAVSLGLALGWPIDSHRLVFLVLGLAFLLLGNVLPRLESNWWMGIRTPWTLESERVWRDTHRLGGRTFVVGGLVLILAGLFLPGSVRGWVDWIAIALAVGIPLVYSYVDWRREAEAAGA